MNDPRQYASKISDASDSERGLGAATSSGWGKGDERETGYLTIKGGTMTGGLKSAVERSGDERYRVRDATTYTARDARRRTWGKGKIKSG